MRRYLIIFVLIVLAGLIYSLNYKENTDISDSTKLQVVTSFYPLYYFSLEIGGDKVEVINVTPAGAEPHEFEPTPEDIAHISQSKIVVLNGGGLEPWGENVRENYKDKEIVVVREDLMTLESTEEDHEGEEKDAHEEILDPHVWLSPVLAEKIVDKITEGFMRVDETNKDYYLANANNLKGRLKELDNLFKEELQSCSERNIITSHAAFGYLALAYDLNQIPISGLSPDAEPSPRELAEIAKFAKDNNIKYIFFESLVSPKLANTLASEIGAQTLVLNPIEGLTPLEIKDGKDYFSEMKNNLNNLKTALRCSKE